MSDIPHPYADPECPDCGGRGFIYPTGRLFDGGHTCACAIDGLKLDNMRKIWTPLPDAIEVKQFRENPGLKPFLNRSAWITSPAPLFRAQLKALCYHKNPQWDARVIADGDILNAWFGTLKAQGAKIYDVEIEESVLSALDVQDLVEPPPLLIIRMGVKRLPNKEAPNSLAEALSIREHIQKPVWVVDTPDYPLDGRHRFFSEDVEKFITKMARVKLVGKDVFSEDPRQTRLRKSLVAEDVDSVVDLLMSSEDSTPRTSYFRQGPEVGNSSSTPPPPRQEPSEEESSSGGDTGVGTRSYLGSLDLEGDSSKKKKRWKK